MLTHRRLLVLGAFLAWHLAAVWIPASAAEPFLKGTLLRMSASEMVVKTDTGEVTLPYDAKTQFNVRVDGKLSDLPVTSLPCSIDGSWKAPEPMLLTPRLIVIWFPGQPIPPSGGWIRLLRESAANVTSAEFETCLGTLLNEPIVPKFFIRKEQEHHDLLVDAGGDNPHQFSPGPFAGQTLAMKATDGVFNVEYDFGANLEIAGKNPRIFANRVIVDATRPNDTQLTIRIKRVEPFNPRNYLRK